MYRTAVVYYLLFIIGGMILAYFYGRHTKKFLWREYLAMFALPLLGIIFFTYYIGINVLVVFILGVIILPVLEWIFGFTYYKILGSHLWVYERYSWRGRHTSWLTLPVW